MRKMRNTLGGHQMMITVYLFLQKRKKKRKGKSINANVALNSQINKSKQKI